MSSTVPTSPPKRRARHRLRWAALALTMSAGLGIFAYQEIWAEAAPAVRTAPVVIGDIEKTVTSLGALQPKDYVEVGAQVSGQLEKVHVEIGDRVEAGDLLAEIDPTVFETRVRTNKANLANLQAQLAQRKAELALARRQLTRNETLFAAKIISEDVLQTGETQVQVGVAAIAALEAQIDAAQATYDGDVANLGYTRIYAPMAGTVVSQTALEGQTLNANQSAPTILRIANLDIMTVWAQVAEADVVKLAPGVPAYFTTLGLPERRWQGMVRQILPTPEIVNDVVLYNVLIDVDNADNVLMAEMTAQVFFVLDEARDVPLVPLAALGPAHPDAADEYQVRVMTSDGPSLRVVKLGLRNRASAAVLSGLDVGEQVILDAPSAAGSGDGPRRRMGFRL